MDGEKKPSHATFPLKTDRICTVRFGWTRNNFSENSHITRTVTLSLRLTFLHAPRKFSSADTPTEPSY
jgi:hypothetical protein